MPEVEPETLRRIHRHLVGPLAETEADADDYFATVATLDALLFPREIEMTGPRFLWWKFVHNALIHPLLALPWEPRWALRAHDWTAQRCWGAG